MHYEIHLTFSKNTLASQIGTLQKASQFYGGKLLLIDLVSPKQSELLHPSQLMFARKIELNDDQEAIHWSTYIEQQFKKYDPVRMKLESELAPGAAKYYEAHWKVTLFDHENLKGFLKSRSVFDLSKYYVSKRAYNNSEKFVDHNTVKLDFDRSKQKILDLHGRHFHIDKDHYERVIIDSSPMTDYGWDPEVRPTDD